MTTESHIGLFSVSRTLNSDHPTVSKREDHGEVSPKIIWRTFSNLVLTVTPGILIDDASVSWLSTWDSTRWTVPSFRIPTPRNTLDFLRCLPPSGEVVLSGPLSVQTLEKHRLRYTVFKLGRVTDLISWEIYRRLTDLLFSTDSFRIRLS